ncbi:MAG TPA: MCE family protein [Rugosimonospora sp.]|nr:MCE family protein [Rugosimonospora sp.]
MYRLLGIAFIALLGAALTLSVLAYRKAFTPVDWVTLRADHTGLQVLPGAEVKLRGVQVGEVRQVSADGQAATLRLALDPGTLGEIPDDVTARLLPQTLFGERYVALEVPAPSSTVPLRDGAVIGQDRTSSAVELEQVLDDTLPLLRAVQPDKLAATLAALAGALEGRGATLGTDLSTLDGYLAALNTRLPALKADVQKLSRVLSTYDGALPDLLSLLRNASVTANTVTRQRDALAAFLADATDTAGSARAFVQRYGDRIIQFGTVTAPVLQVLAAYSPEYPCLLRALVALQPTAEQVFAGGQMHITLEVTRDNGRYLPGHDEPAYAANSGPDCRGLPHPPVPAPQVDTPDGYDYGASRPALDPLPLTLAPMGYAGTPEERSLLKPLVAGVTGTDPGQVPDVADLLWGPLLRGTVVDVP